MQDRLIIKEDKKISSMSDYVWLNFEINNKRIGKARVICLKDELIINSVNIYPKYERHGYARQIIEHFKNEYSYIIADRVRVTAVGFWEKMGFRYSEDGNYYWENKCNTKNKQMGGLNV